MSAEQVWDSLAGLTVEGLDQRRGHGTAILNARGKLAELCQMSPLRLRKTLEAPLESNPLLVKRLAPLSPETALASEDERYWTWDLSGMAKPCWSWLPRCLVRASELPSPVWAGHFLEHFGQSARDLDLEAPRPEPALQQVFDLFNGEIHDTLWDPRSVLARETADATDPSRQIEVIFLAILNRRPEERERQLCLEHFRDDSSAGRQRVAWALINSPEFLFVR
jgi:hypothetical protein